MPDFTFLNFHIPEWVQIFVIAGIAFVIIAVPLRILWKATRKLREESEKLAQFTDRLRERFDEVKVHAGFFGPASTSFKHKARRFSISVHNLKSLVLRLDENPTPKLPLVVTTKRRFMLPWSLLGLRALPRMRMLDPVLDDAVAIYTTPIYGAYLRETIQDAVDREGKPSGITESIIVLRRLPGVRRFRLAAIPEGTLTVRLLLSTEDLFYRPDVLESAVHHLGLLHVKLVQE